MNHANHHIHFGADGHPTLELLRQYQEGLLSPALSHQLEHHLLDCDLCADLAEGMTLSDATQTEVAVADIKLRLEGKKEKDRAAAWYADWRAVAAVFVLICSALMVFYYQYTNLRSTPETIAVEKSGTIVQELEPTLNYAPPVALLDEEVAEEHQAEQATVKSDLNRPRTIVAPVAHDKFIADEEIVVDEITVEELAYLEEPPKVDLSGIDFKADSTATIATAKPKARVAAAAPQMNLERALQGQVAGVAVQHKTSEANLVQGKVTDDAGNPLPGVMVQVKGTMLGVSTDKDGNFSLQVPADKNVLNFRYIGFETKEQRIDSTKNSLAVNLQSYNQALSEVVVTGYSKRAAIPVIEKPRPTIGTRAYKLYLKNEQQPLNTKAKGRVIVGFTVSENGQIDNVRVLRSLSPEADAEAVRLIQQGPAWEPAMQNGNRVAQQVKVVVRFR